MPQSLVTQCKGLHTNNSDISSVPSGSLKIGRNIALSKENIIQPRNGFSDITYAIDTVSVRANDFFCWKNGLLVKASDNHLYYDTGSAFSSMGDLVPPTTNGVAATHISSVNSKNKNIYFTSSEGIKKTDALGTSLYSTNTGLIVQSDIGLTSAATCVALPNGQTASYRVIICYKDANGNIIKGAVSQKWYVSNSSGQPANPWLIFYIPSGLTTNHFVQVYRINEVTGQEGSDELQLCYEAYITATDISNGYFVFDDELPSEYLGATIYTALSQEGIVNNNDQAPISKEICEFKNTMFFGDIEYQHTCLFTLLGANTVTAKGFRAGDTITVTLGATVEVYTAVTSGATGNQFYISTSSDPVLKTIYTIQSFLTVLYANSAIVYGIEVSSDNTLPATVRLYTRSYSAGQFTVTSSRPASFSPTLDSLNSSADKFTNGLAFSKPFQVEAVPLKNVLKVGASHNRILKLAALRDSLFIFKENEGVWILKGDSEANFTLEQLDNTANLVSVKSISVVNNMIYGLFKNGICEVSETGVTIISDPIKDQIDAVLKISESETNTFSMSDEINGRYILSVTTVSENYTSKQFVFDTFKRTFVSWDLGLSAGIHNYYDKKLYVGFSDSNKVAKEKIAGDYTDYADTVTGYSISSHSGTTLTMNSVTGISVGDIIKQSTLEAYVESVGTTTIVVDDDLNWSNSSVTLLRGIDVSIEWNPDFGGNPAQSKHYYEMVMLSRSNFQKRATFTFYSDENPSERAVSIPMDDADGYGLFGNFEFGEENFGGDVDSLPYRLGIPRDHSRCSSLSVRFDHHIAYSNFKIMGISFSFNPISTRISR